MSKKKITKRKNAQSYNKGLATQTQGKRAMTGTKKVGTVVDPATAPRRPRKVIG